MLEIFMCGAAALLVYWNALFAGFAYDDTRAIIQNPDLLPSTPLSNIFKDDFWGTPIGHSGSHKSYRPLCVLSFRLNHAFGELEPMGYHLINVLLHCLVTMIFTYTARKLLLRTFSTTVAGLIFAVHPIHTEAVTGIVGRADVGACLFFLLSFISYFIYCERRTGESCSRLTWVFLSSSCALFSMLTKEPGVTILAVNMTYDLFVFHKISPFDLPQVFVKKKYSWLREGMFLQLTAGVLFVGLRLYIIGSSLPNFAPSDNPAADSDHILTRILTFAFLPAFNSWLLLCPNTLSFDWSMGAIPLVESLFDFRNVFSLTFYSFLVILSLWILKELSVLSSDCEELSDEQVPTELNGNSFKLGFHILNKRNGTKPFSRTVSVNRVNGVYRRTSLSAIRREASKKEASSFTHEDFSSRTKQRRCVNALIISLAFLIFPFLLATNLLFYVGFVIAERILYIPSMGFCLLVAIGAEHLLEKQTPVFKKALYVLLVCLLALYACRTVRRNQDWFSEETLYQSGISVNPAKAWGNLANILKTNGRVAEAEVAYRNALMHRSNMADVHYNLGILLQEEERYQEAIESYQRAIHFRPRLSMAHLNLGIVLGLVGQAVDAEKVYRHASTLTDDGLKDPKNQIKGVISSMFNLGRLMQDQGRYEEALQVFQEALERKPDFYPPQSLYNMLGETYYHLGNLQEAERWYKQSLENKPDHVPAHLTYANLLSRMGHTKEAEDLLQRAVELEPRNPQVYRHYGQIINELGRHSEAAEQYQKSYDLKPNDFEIAFNLANALRQAGQNEQAEAYYRQAAQLKPNEANPLMNLGAMLHLNNKLEDAEKSYLRALELKPGDETTMANLKKLRSLMKKRSRRR